MLKNIQLVYLPQVVFLFNETYNVSLEYLFLSIYK